ncbi:MAG: permease [Deltaproteobacteria bacterium]|nr:permease [Deltaproteobacteria bacterium]
MIEAASQIVSAAWQVLCASAPYVIFGLLMAGLLKGIIPDSFVSRHLGGNSVRAVIKASLLGMPLPLCSCGVVPVAASLRKQGAGPGPTTAFLISTPETGVDSIAITWALLDPVMTVVRPLAAFITATTAGLLVNLLPAKPPGPACALGRSCCNTTCTAQHSSPKMPLRRALPDGIRYAFTQLLGDIGPYLLAGIAIAGLITWLIPDGFIEQHLGSGIIPMLIMLAAGIPLYVCASASTPIVAALALKGLSPGAALVFLLAGPATNAAAITVVAALLGRPVAAVYVSVIALCALVMGMAVNMLYGWLAIDISSWASGAQHSHDSMLPVVAALALLALILRAVARRS